MILAAAVVVATCGSDAAPTTQATPAAVGGPAFNLDVTTYKGGNTRTGVTPGPGPSGRPEVLWERVLPDISETQPLVVGGTVIVATAGGDLIGIDAATNADVFAWKLAAGVLSTGAAHDGTYYVVTEDGMLRAVSLATGKERWTAVRGFSPAATVAVVDGLVIAGSDGQLAAINIADGTEAWRVDTEGSTRVAVDAGFGYATADDSGAMTMIDLASGKVVKSIQVGGADVLTAGLDRDGVVVGYRDVPGGENGVATIKPDGTDGWRQPSDDHARVETVSVTDDLVVVFTEEPAGVEAHNRSTGGLVWSGRHDGPFIGGGVVADDVVYLVAADDGLIALDIASGQQLWTLPLEGAQRVVRLVVTDGLVIATMPADNGAGRVIALAGPTDPRLLALRSRSTATPTPVPSPTAATAPDFEVVAVEDVEGEAFPMAPALGPDGTLYMVDPHSNRILLRAADGTLSWWGTEGTGEGQFDFTSTTQGDGGGGVAVSPDGRLIAVSEGGNHRVQLFDGRRQYIKTIGRLGTGNGQFVNPGASIDSQHRIWVVDVARQDIQLFTEDGTYVSTFDGNGQLTGPGAVFVREDTGEVYIPDFDSRRISVFDEHGTWLRNYGSLPEEGLRFSEINKVQVDEAGRMFVVDTSNRIFVLDPDGHLIGTIPSVLPDGIGAVSLPGFALDQQGRLYLADVAQTRIIVLQLLPPLWPPPG